MKQLLSATILAAIVIAASPSLSSANEHTQWIVPFLGITEGTNGRKMGKVAYVILTFQKRTDTDGLAVHFLKTPGKFSKMAETAIDEAIRRAAKALHTSPDSWTVTLRVPYEKLTIYGESISAMVGVVTVRIANGEPVLPDRVMTGTITPEGFIGPVGSVPLKVLGGAEAHMRRILVPEETDVADADWTTPFLVQVSPVRTVKQAYECLGLTERKEGVP